MRKNYLIDLTYTLPNHVRESVVTKLDSEDFAEFGYDIFDRNDGTFDLTLDEVSELDFDAKVVPLDLSKVEGVAKLMATLDEIGDAPRTCDIRLHHSTYTTTTVLDSAAIELLQRHRLGLRLFTYPSTFDSGE